MDLSMLFVFVFTAGVDGLDVHGPTGPVLAQLQGSVHLPCFSESPLPLEGLQVEWRKMDSNSIVSLFKHGESRQDLQSQEFRSRADVFLDEIFKGNFSILLKNMTEKDAGIYRCQVTTSHISSEVIMEIKVIKHFVVTGADRSVFAHEGEDVILNCSVDSHVPVSEIEEVTWKKTDQDQDMLVLLYQSSQIFPESSHEQYQGRVDLFPSEIPKGNFSLKLTGVRIEDKGEFMCEVHIRNMSAHTIVVLQDVGFSALHITILVLCLVSLLLAIGLCGPVFNLLRKKDTSNKAMKMHISLILCPNICIFVAFCLWSKEGLLAEVITCSTISIIRPIMLLKTFLYIGRLPRKKNFLFFFK
ncbi:butyrophilin-like protein 9 [Clarias gariepinus]|uniref:butyrophilin-like protein 9 n=1 Tax=Clarias gariepinus TaxID=13013 RepID=UPI00234D32FB|nr:butyrophilin-like protein 9 [Clarias gariepinus]